MIPYIIFALLLLYFSNRSLYVHMLLITLVFATVRYDVGWDYMTYYDIAKAPEDDLDFQRFSFFWQQIIMFANRIQYPELALIIPSILIYSVGFCGIYIMNDGDEEKICNSLLVYVFWPYFYLSTFSTIRQGLAISLCLLIYALVKRKQIIWASLLFLFNLFIHPSSVVSIIMFPLLWRDYRIGFKFVVISIGVGVFVLTITSVLLSYVGMYMNYLTGGADFGKGLAVLLLGIGTLLLLCMYVAKTRGIDIEFLGIVIIAFFIEAAIYLLGLPSVIARVLSYFSILFIFVLFETVNLIDYRLSRSVVIAMVMLFFWYLNHTTLADSNSSGYVPYKTIFYHD